MVITSRAGWGALPPENPPTRWTVGNLDGICQHWFGSPKAASSHAGCDDLLRSVQRTHQAGEYNDIAYNFGVCPHGVVYELRGWHVQTGANGTTDANRRFLAVVYMAGEGDPLTLKGKASLEQLYAEAFSKGVAVHAITHGSITGSQCPGPAVKAWLSSGAWKPKPPEPQRFRYVLVDGEGKTLAKSEDVSGLATPRKARLRSFLGAIVDVCDAEFQRDAAEGKPRDVRIVRVKADAD